MSTTPYNLVSGMLQPQPGVYEPFAVNNGSNTVVGCQVTKSSCPTYFNTIPGMSSIQPSTFSPTLQPLTFTPIGNGQYTFTISCALFTFQNNIVEDQPTYYSTATQTPLYGNIYQMYIYITSTPEDLITPPFNTIGITNYVLQVGVFDPSGNEQNTYTSNTITYDPARQTLYSTGLNIPLSPTYTCMSITNNTFYVGLYFSCQNNLYVVGNTQSNYLSPINASSYFNSSDFPGGNILLASVAAYSAPPSPSSSTATNSMTLLNSMNATSYLNKIYPNSPVCFSAIQNQPTLNIYNILTIYNISELDLSAVTLPTAPSGYTWRVTNVILFCIINNGTNIYTNPNDGYAAIATYTQNSTTSSSTTSNSTSSIPTNSQLYQILTTFFNGLISTNQNSRSSSTTITPFDTTAMSTPPYISPIGEMIDNLTTQTYVNSKSTPQPSYSSIYTSPKFFNISLQLSVNS